MKTDLPENLKVSWIQLINAIHAYTLIEKNLNSFFKQIKQQRVI